MIKSYLKLLYFKLKYSSKINTGDISFNSIIGDNIEVRKNAILYNVKIGDNVFINRNTIIKDCEIGNYSSLGPNCIIGLNEHSTSYFTTCESLYDDTVILKNDKLTKIGPDVWIGANVFIKKGVKISVGSVLGAGAVVTKDTLPYSINLGVPSKCVKFRFNKKRISELINSKWWEERSKEKIYKKIRF